MFSPLVERAFALGFPVREDFLNGCGGISEVFGGIVFLVLGRETSLWCLGKRKPKTNGDFRKRPSSPVLLSRVVVAERVGTGPVTG